MPLVKSITERGVHSDFFKAVPSLFPSLLPQILCEQTGGIYQLEPGVLKSGEIL